MLEIILIAMVAGFIVFRLYTVLGRRTGNERPPQDYRLPGSERETVPARVTPAAPRPVENISDPVQSGLFDISLADRTFDKDKFLAGARAAYEMIETAFAAGDRETLRPLLGGDVYAAFDAVIFEREKAAHRCNFTFVGFKEVKVLAAALKEHIAEITLCFESQFVSATLDISGKVVDGDDKSVRDVTDIWTFSRDVRARNPNWTLIATAGEAS